jgi:hypothetical protein
MFVRLVARFGSVSLPFDHRIPPGDHGVSRRTEIRCRFEAGAFAVVAKYGI